MIRVFLSYSHADEKYRNELAKHLKSLERQGVIDTWHDRRIAPGDEWASGIDGELRRADMILLLVSVDFINSEYCYDLEMEEALTRHNRGEAVVIPIILRPCHFPVGYNTENDDLPTVYTLAKPNDAGKGIER